MAVMCCGWLAGESTDLNQQFERKTTFASCIVGINSASPFASGIRKTVILVAALVTIMCLKQQ